jgi:hypothetical protein
MLRDLLEPEHDHTAGLVSGLRGAGLDHMDIDDLHHFFALPGQDQLSNIGLLHEYIFFDIHLGEFLSAVY